MILTGAYLVFGDPEICDDGDEGNKTNTENGLRVEAVAADGGNQVVGDRRRGGSLNLVAGIRHRCFFLDD